MNAELIPQGNQTSDACQPSPREFDVSRAVSRQSRRFQVMLLGYLISFALPAIKTMGNFGTLWGFQAFAGSSLALLDLYPYWLANPAFWLGLYFFHRSRWRIAATCGFLASLFALSVPIIMRWEAQLRSPPPGLTSTLLPGYYLWLASFVVLTILSVRSSMTYRS